MTAVDSKTSSSPDKPDKSEATEASEPVKRPRGRPRKTAVSEPAKATVKKETKPAEKKAEKADVKKTSTLKPGHRVPRDQPSEWIVPRDDDDEKSVSDTRATSVKQIDDDTIRSADDTSDEISEAEIRARREAARAVVADIDRMKDDVKSMNSYIATPPPEVAAEAHVDAADSIDETAPLSRREYWKQRRQERYLQRQQRRPTASNGPASDGAARPSVRQDRTRPTARQAPSSRQDYASSESPTKPTEILPPLKVSDLQGLSADALLAMADEQKILHTLASHAKSDTVFALLRNHAARGGAVIGEGVLEICQEGHGYLRNPLDSFRSSPEDAMVPLQMIRKFSLRPGDSVSGVTRPPTRDQRERRFVVIDVVLVNGTEPVAALRAPLFDSLEVVHPNRLIQLETTADEVEMRVADLFTPIGFGQRGLVLAPPRTGRRVLLRKLANAIERNHPEAELMILLIDDRPEEVTDMRRKTNAKIYSSTFDQTPASHVQTAEVALDFARRNAECGKDVIVLLDSLTRLAKAYNALEPHGGRILQGGFDVNALHKAKRLFSAARNLEGGGSLTLIATVPVETSNRADEVVVEEFQNAANTLVWLDRQLAERRIYPPLDIAKSGTRHDSHLLTPEAHEAILALRKSFESSTAEEAMQDVLKRLAQAADNAKLLATFCPNV